MVQQKLLHVSVNKKMKNDLTAMNRSKKDLKPGIKAAKTTILEKKSEILISDKNLTFQQDKKPDSLQFLKSFRRFNFSVKLNTYYIIFIDI